MASNEIEVPKDARPIMMEQAEETKLGDKNGCLRQYRYGNLHIREYRDKYLVHVDKVDPRQDPLGHLIRDSPETIAGLLSAVYGGSKMYQWAYNKSCKQNNDHYVKNKPSDYKRIKYPIIAGVAFSGILGYAGYKIAKGVKINLEK